MYDQLQVGRCYVFSNGSVKYANRQYNACNRRFELTFQKGFSATPAQDDGSISTHQFNVVDLRAVQTRGLPTTVDICGVIVMFTPVVSFTSKEKKDLVKREITVADDTATSMDITLWGERAKEEDAKFDGKPVVALKGVIVKEWNGGLCGSLLQSGVVDFEPKGAEFDRIRRWWTEGGASQAISALSKARGGGIGARRVVTDATIMEMRQEADGIPDEQKMFSVCARLSAIQTTKQGEPVSLTYPACTLPREGRVCNRRVDERGFCASCNQSCTPAARMNLRCRFVDHADSAWLATFNEAGAAVLGMTPDELAGLELQAAAGGSDGLAAFEERLMQRYYMNTPFQLTCRVKADSYQGVRRGNASVVDARAIDRREHGRKLLAEIQQLAGAIAVC